jgi:hypothetical protein
MTGGRNNKGNGNDAENLIWKNLQAQLQPGETLLRNVRFTDARHGDVEVDFLILFPDCGAIVLEVKGGLVSYQAGQWITRRSTEAESFRRINPIAQARKGKHALRRYLDRQPEWQHPLLKSAWCVAMPQTDVTGDMGPEGKREHLIGSNDLDELRTRMRNLLEDSIDNDTLPSGDWHDEALTLILRLDHTNGDHPFSEPAPRRQPWIIPAMTIAAAFAVLAVLTALFTIRGGWLALAIIVLATAATYSLVLPRLSNSTPLRAIRTWLVFASAFGIALGFAGALALYGEKVTDGNCDPNYIPCIPITDDHNCSDIKIAVRVIGEDIYGLDRDGNGIGCESYS